jgi:hypothetical protein
LRFVSLTDLLVGLISTAILAAVTYRIARFLILDELIEELRDSFHAKLTEHPNRLTIKLQILMLCPFCLTIWVSLVLHAYWYLLVVDWPDWAFPVYVLGAAAGSLVFWHYIDAED